MHHISLGCLRVPHHVQTRSDDDMEAKIHSFYVVICGEPIFDDRNNDPQYIILYTKGEIPAVAALVDHLIVLAEVILKFEVLIYG